MSQYQKSCTYCNATIEMSDDNGKWLPYNMDGSIHQCKKQKQSVIATETKKVETKEDKALKFVREIQEGPKLKELDERLRRVEEKLFGGIWKKE